MKWVLFVFVGLLVVITVMAVIGSLLPKGHVASRMARFRATPDSVWALITGEPMWRPGVRGFERVSEEGGRRVWREVDSHGRAITFEAIEEVPPKRLVTRIADTNLPFG